MPVVTGPAGPWQQPLNRQIPHRGQVGHFHLVGQRE